jgi:hypothetical protein
MTGVFSLLMGIAVLIYHWRTRDLPNMFSYLFALPPIIAGGFALLSPGRTRTAILMIAGATLAGLIVALLFAAPTFAERESSKRLLQLADSRGYSQAVIYGMQRSDRTPEFYAAGRVVYGADGEPIMYAGAEQVIDESRRRNDVLLTFVPVGEVGRLTEIASAQMEVIGDNGRYAIVAVRAR